MCGGGSSVGNVWGWFVGQGPVGSPILSSCSLQCPSSVCAGVGLAGGWLRAADVASQECWDGLFGEGSRFPSAVSTGKQWRRFPMLIPTAELPTEGSAMPPPAVPSPTEGVSAWHPRAWWGSDASGGAPWAESPAHTQAPCTHCPPGSGTTLCCQPDCPWQPSAPPGAGRRRQSSLGAGMGLALIAWALMSSASSPRETPYLQQTCAWRLPANPGISGRGGRQMEPGQAGTPGGTELPRGWAPFGLPWGHQGSLVVTSEEHPSAPRGTPTRDLP